MFKPSDLKKVRLKKTGKKLKNQTKYLSPKIMLCKDETDFHKLMEETYIEKYFSHIKEFSFDSDFCILSRWAIIALMNAYTNMKEMEKKGSETKLEEEKQDNEILSKLVKDIDKIKAKHDWKYIFVRTSIRSPKDAAIQSNKFDDLVRSERQWVEAHEKEIGMQTSKTNRSMRALYRAMTYALRCDSGKECVTLLSKSARLQADFRKHLQSESVLQCMVRRFCHFDPCMEFRGFVYKKKFTALTQYNDFCFFPELVAIKDDLLNCIKKQANVLIDKVAEQLASFVIDFVLYHDDDTSFFTVTGLKRYQNLNVSVIEINPLAEFAGTGLFSWENDKPILLGEKGFEFRIRTEESKFGGQTIDPSFQKYID